MWWKPFSSLIPHYITTCSYKVKIVKPHPCFKYISKIIPKLSTETIKAGIFYEAQIREIIKDCMKDKEKSTLIEFTWVVQIFLGKNKHPTYWAAHVASGELGEHLHQDIRTMEEWHQGRWNAKIIVGYCWSIENKTDFSTHARKIFLSC